MLCRLVMHGGGTAPLRHTQTEWHTGGVDTRCLQRREQLCNIRVKHLTQGLQGAQRDILVFILDAHDSGLGNTDFAGEHPLRYFAPPLPYIPCQSLPQINHKWFILEALNHKRFMQTGSTRALAWTATPCVMRIWRTGEPPAFNHRFQIASRAGSYGTPHHPF